MTRPLKRVSKAELRKLFNDGSYWQRTQFGEFTERIDRENPISERKRKKLDMPKGSKSQLVAYDDAEGTQIILAHQYVKPSGAIRTDTRPDPKWILVDGVIHCLHPEPPPECRKPRL